MDIRDECGVTAEMAATLVLRVGYRGAGFVGYAEQPGRRSVAGELRGALETLLRRPVELTCAGRTDAGVHAVGQYVSLPVTADDLRMDASRISRALTALVPDDVSIRGVYRAAPGFSARFDATARSYRYRIVTGARPVHLWEGAWWLRDATSLDAAAMGRAAAALVGEHDFTSFCKGASAAALRAEGRSTSRNVTHVAVGNALECGDATTTVAIVGNAFLHNMVRIIVGTLVEVGRGRRDAGWVADVLAAHDRRAAGRTAPPQGLTLEGVTYPPGSLTPW